MVPQPPRTLIAYISSLIVWFWNFGSGVVSNVWSRNFQTRRRLLGTILNELSLQGGLRGPSAFT
eukprot:6468476-Amphidinium_carterae.1